MPQMSKGKTTFLRIFTCRIRPRSRDLYIHNRESLCIVGKVVVSTLSDVLWRDPSSSSTSAAVPLNILQSCRRNKRNLSSEYEKLVSVAIRFPTASANSWSIFRVRMFDVYLSLDSAGQKTCNTVTQVSRKVFGTMNLKYIAF